MSRVLELLAFVVLIVSLSSCTGSPPVPDVAQPGGDADGDADADTDSDTDGDADGDTDTDSDTDADSDADGDLDADADGDSDGDADTAEDTETETQDPVDTETSWDTDSESESETEWETDTDSETAGDVDADTDTDTDTDTDIDGDSDSDSDSDTGPAYPCGLLPPTGTWCDATAGLLWQTNPNPTASYYDAYEACGQLVVEDLADWAIPTVTEARTLVRGCPSVMPGGNCDAPADFTWCNGCPGDGPGINGCFWPDEMGGECNNWFWTGIACLYYWRAELQPDCTPAETLRAYRCVHAAI